MGRGVLPECWAHRHQPVRGDRGWVSGEEPVCLFLQHSLQPPGCGRGRGEQEWAFHPSITTHTWWAHSGLRKQTSGRVLPDPRAPCARAAGAVSWIWWDAIPGCWLDPVSRSRPVPFSRHMWLAIRRETQAQEATCRGWDPCGPGGPLRQGSGLGADLTGAVTWQACVQGAFTVPQGPGALLVPPQPTLTLVSSPISLRTELQTRWGEVSVGGWVVPGVC